MRVGGDDGSVSHGFVPEVCRTPRLEIALVLFFLDVCQSHAPLSLGVRTGRERCREEEGKNTPRRMRSKKRGEAGSIRCKEDFDDNIATSAPDDSSGDT